jgi:hypothetical protein
MQKLMGRLNDLALMCPFLKTFKAHLNIKLSHLQIFPVDTVVLDEQDIKDLYVWAGFLLDPNPWKPICPRPCAPPLSCVSFTSDAAGFNSKTKLDLNIGCSSIGFSITGEIVFAAQTFWPKDLLKMESLGSNTTFLEMVGLLLPFLLIPKSLTNKHVILRVDNIACYYAWLNKYVKNDLSASIITRALVVISAFLECQIHVEHLPRMSSWDARACDRMSRESSMSPNDRALLESFGNLKCPELFTRWLESGCNNWGITSELLEFVENKCKDGCCLFLFFGKLFWCFSSSFSRTWKFSHLLKERTKPPPPPVYFP